MKTLIWAMSMLATIASLHADDVLLHWTGAAGDGKWSTSGNWQENVSPKDVGTTETRVLVFPNGSVSSNDWSSLGIKQMVFSGAGESIVTGGRISFDANAGDGMIRVIGGKVTIRNEVYDNWGSSFYSDQGELVFEGPVIVRDPAATRTLTVKNEYGHFNPDAKVRFLGGVTGNSGSNIHLDLQLGRADDFGKSYCHHLESALNVRNFTIGGSYRTVTMQIDCANQEWETVRIINGLLIAGAANVFCTTGVIEPNSSYGGSTSYIDLNGFDQTIDRIAGTYRNTGVRSATAATLTMEASDPGNFAGPIEGAVSLVWNPMFDETFDASGVSTTTGNLIVSNGTFLVSGAGSMASVKNITVAPGATLELTTTAVGAFAGAEMLYLDGTLSVSSDVTDPFSGLRVVLGEGGQISVPEGKTISLTAVSVNGAYLTDDDYTTGWVTGGGTVRVDSSIISGTTFTWKNAADGQWSTGSNWFGDQAPDGSKPQLITVGGADYTVTVPNNTDIEGELRIGGSADAGVATVSPVGATSLAAGSRTTISSHGRLAVPAGATLTLAADTSASTSDHVVDLADGGVFEVCGGQLTADDFYGLLSVGNDGTFAVSSGRGDFQAHSPSASSAGNINGLWVAAGGTVEVSGTGVLALHSGQWGAFPLVNVGGTVRVKGEGTLLFDSVHSAQGKEYSEYVGGSGRIELSDNGKIAFDDGTAGSIMFPCVYGNGQVEISVTDNAAFCFTNGTVVVGKSFWYGPALPSMQLTLESDAVNHLGNNLILGADGRNGLVTTMTIGRGCIKVGSDGLKMARRNEPQDTITSPVANVVITNGALVVNGVNADQGEAYYTAFELGNSLPEDAKTSSTAVYTATFTQSGGVVSNLHGRLTLGTGKALGRYVQSGGEFVSGSRAAAFLGAYDGEGRWEMTGGTATFNETIYLGIGSTLATLLGGSAQCKLGTHDVGTAATGVLDIEGGRFETAGDIITGTDGNHGEITVGPGGVLAAANLRMLNAASDKLTIKVGTNDVGAIRLSGGLDLASGIKLKIEGADTYAGTGDRFDLITCEDTTHPLTEVVIEGTIPERMRLSRTASRIRLVTNPKGLAILVR